MTMTMMQVREGDGVERGGQDDYDWISISSEDSLEIVAVDEGGKTPDVEDTELDLAERVEGQDSDAAYHSDELRHEELWYVNLLDCCTFPLIMADKTGAHIVFGLYCSLCLPLHNS